MAATERTVCSEPGCGQEYGPGIERAIHLRKYHVDIYRSEYSEQRARRNYKRGWDEDGGNPALTPADNEDNELPDDLAFRIPGYASSRHDLKRLEKCFISGRFRCPTPFCCKSYKTVDGLQYHLAKSMCVPSEEWLAQKRAGTRERNESQAEDPAQEEGEAERGESAARGPADCVPQAMEQDAHATPPHTPAAGPSTDAPPGDGPSQADSEPVAKQDSEDHTQPDREASEQQPSVQLMRDEPYLTSYRWPQNETGVWTVTQAVLRNFLDGIRVHRVYPELERRYATDEERQFIKQKNIGREAHIFGIVVFKAEEAIKIIEAFHPEKYEQFLQYRAGVMNYEPRKAVEVPVITAEEALAAAEHVKEIALQLNQDFLSLRRSTCGCAYEPLTQTVWTRVCDQARPALPSPSAHPVALVPGQFFEGSMRFTLQQAREFVSPPVPPPLSRNPPARPLGDRPAAAGSVSAAAAKAESTAVTRTATEGAIVSAETKALQKHVQLRIQERQRSSKSAVVMPRAPSNAACAMCHLVGRKGREELVTCVKCRNTSHPSCLELAPELVAVIKTYDWECMECKTCTVCRDPYDEENLMFCDECDRGYHTYCVQLQSIPKGRWVCKSCGQCASCGTTTPGNDGARWRHEYTKPNEAGDRRFLCTLCTSCSMLFRLGNFCPFCLIVYRSNDTDLPMVCCDVCDRWIHCDCDHITQAMYKKLSTTGAKYTCSLCRGEQEERHDAFHRKYRR